MAIQREYIITEDQKEAIEEILKVQANPEFSGMDEYYSALQLLFDFKYLKEVAYNKQHHGDT